MQYCSQLSTFFKQIHIPRTGASLEICIYSQYNYKTPLHNPGCLSARFQEHIGQLHHSASHIRNCYFFLLSSTRAWCLFHWATPGTGRGNPPEGSTCSRARRGVELGLHRQTDGRTDGYPTETTRCVWHVAHILILPLVNYVEAQRVTWCKLMLNHATQQVEQDANFTEIHHRSFMFM